MASHYEVLGVSQDASIEEIRRAYRARAQQFHPDSHPDASEERSRELALQFAEVAAAWEVLRDPKRRQRYDEGLAYFDSDEFNADPADDGFPVGAQEMVLFALANNTRSIYGDIESGSIGSDALALLISLTLPSLGELIEEDDHGDLADQFSIDSLLAFRALRCASEIVNKQLLAEQGGLNAYIPEFRSLYEIVFNAAKDIRKMAFPNGLPNGEEDLDDLQKRLNIINRSRKRLFDPSVPLGPYPVCIVCGSGPAEFFSFDSLQGMLIAFRKKTIRGTFCKSCAQMVGREMQTETLVRGWWGIISFLYNPLIAIGNATQLRRAGRMANPQAVKTSLRPPVDPGPPMGNRRAPLVVSIIALLIAGGIIGIAVAANQPRDPVTSSGTASSSFSSGSSSLGTNSKSNRSIPVSTFTLGGCVDINLTGALPVSCSGYFNGRVVNVSNSSRNCYSIADIYVQEGGRVYCIDRF